MQENEIREHLIKYGFRDLQEVFQRADLHKTREQINLIGWAKVDSNFIFQDVNEVTCEIIGLSYAELVGGTFTEITPAPIKDIDADMARKVIEGKLRHYQLAKYYNPRKGQFIFVLIQPLAALNLDGSFDHFDVFIMPITIDDYIRIQKKMLKRVLLPEGFSLPTRNGFRKWLSKLSPKGASEWGMAIAVAVIMVATAVQKVLEHFGVSFSLFSVAP